MPTGQSDRGSFSSEGPSSKYVRLTTKISHHNLLFQLIILKGGIFNFNVYWYDLDSRHCGNKEIHMCGINQGVCQAPSAPSGHGETY